ncbi:patatin-like phospholipase family protein [Flavimaricola marinus]|uniref:Patatin-like phospholipase n=1 Tax=Flavimaricola marinus TaxID=1819565 RepID=A0A238LER0_9RHOB|nr:patatin-like phospholipase family protein [Flavimaricola marinus]SMY07446.1 Patatin-like phospholipase [Flavimaricola marinus]
MTTKINLALQGGGVHGAFTWGVLDRLLEESEIEIAAITGTSAGAMNAAAFKSGYLKDGNAGARETLDWFWEQIGAVNDPWFSDWLSAMAPTIPSLASAIEASPAYMAFDMANRMTSPYVFGSMLRNPLERVVRQLQFDKVCDRHGPELYIGATNVRTGKVRVFTGEEISTDVLLASACLPTLFQAVEIDDPKTGRTEAYWDGGYTGNPALFPLYQPHLPRDIMIVNINPLVRDEVPTDSQSIQNRINEISFNASLLGEIRSIAFVKRLLAEGVLKSGTKKDVHLHMVSDDALMNDLNVATKTIPVPVILTRLKDAGRDAMDGFLSRHAADLGERSTVDLTALFA